MTRSIDAQIAYMPGMKPALSSVGSAAYREAMSRLASAVHIVTTDGPGGRAGFTATAVCSVSDAPPTLLVCINRGGASHGVFSQNESLCVSTLGLGHESLAGAFGGQVHPAERFALGDWTSLVTGAPVLADALVAFDCRIVGRHQAGSHDVLYCEVQAVSTPGEADALVYAGRSYRSVANAAKQLERVATLRAFGNCAGASCKAKRSEAA